MNQSRTMAIKKTITEKRRNKMGTPAFVVSVMFFGVLVIVGAFFIGKSDTGQINVAATIQNSNQENGGEAAVGVVPEAFRNMPNGGLVPAENQDPQPPVEEVAPPTDAATTTATTTEDGTLIQTEEGDEIPTDEENSEPPVAEEGGVTEEATTAPVN